MSAGSGTPAPRRARSRYAQNIPDPSPASSVVSQATGSPFRRATQSATSRVFPAPAEPLTMVSGVRSPRSRCLVSRSRRRNVAGSEGTAKRVRRNGYPCGSAWSSGVAGLSSSGPVKALTAPVRPCSLSASQGCGRRALRGGDLG